MSSLVIKNGSKITLNFSLGLDDGGVIDSNFESAPVELTIGSGDMLPGFERVLYGHKAGDTLEKIINATDAFGERNDENKQRINRSQFGDQPELAEGLVVMFADQRGGELPGVVAEVGEKEVVVDFNHPLSGRNIWFKAVIHEVLS